MAVAGIQCKGHILIDAVPLRPVLISPADHGPLEDVGLLFCPGLCRQRPRHIFQIPDFIALVLGKGHNRDPALGTVRPPTVLVQRPRRIRLVEAGMRVSREHGVAGFGADAVGHEHRLVIIAAEGSGFLHLYLRPLAASLASGTDLQGLRRQFLMDPIHHQRYVVPAGAHSAGPGLDLFRFPDADAGICRMVVQGNGSRHHAGPKSWGGLFLIADASGICAVLGTETSSRRFPLIHHHRRVVRLRPKSADHILGHIHPGTSLVVQDDPSPSSRIRSACCSKAFFRISGNAFPLAEALRSIPRHAFRLK